MAAALSVAAAVLLLVACNGRSDEGADATEETRMGEQLLYVNSELVECEGVVPQQCMQVRRSPDDDWELYYGEIDGFAFEPGYTYKLRVNVTPAASVPADASSLRYELVEVEERQPA